MVDLASGEVREDGRYANYLLLLFPCRPSLYVVQLSDPVLIPQTENDLLTDV